MSRLFHARHGSGLAAAAVLLLFAAPSRAQVSSLAVEADGAIVAIDSYREAILRVDPTTGAVATVASRTVGSGPSLAHLSDIAVGADGSLLVTAGAHPQAAVLRVDSVSGDRETVSSPTKGGGPPFVGWGGEIAVGPDGTIFVTTRSGTSGSDAILRVDPETGDRTIVSDPTTGGGPSLPESTGLAVEPSGTLAWAGALPIGSTVMRIDPVTGDRTMVSDAATGAGRPFGWLEDVTVRADATLVALDGMRELFCVPLCPHPLCVYCFMNGPTIFRVDPVDGDRRIVSGGGIGFVSGGGAPVTPFFGRRGPGPDLQFPWGLAVESPGSFVVTDDNHVVRVDARTGRRDVLATMPAAATAAHTRMRSEERARRLAALDERRVFRPADPAAWLRQALGDEARGLDLRRPRRLFSGLSPARRRAVEGRLYAAAWKTMRDMLGANHPDTLTAAPPSSDGQD